MAYCLERKIEQTTTSLEKAKKACFGDVNQLQKVSQLNHLVNVYNGGSDLKQDALNNLQLPLIGNYSEFMAIALLENKQYDLLQQLLKEKHIPNQQIYTYYRLTIKLKNWISYCLLTNTSAALYEYTAIIF